MLVFHNMQQNNMKVKMTRILTEWLLEGPDAVMCAMH